MASNAKKHPFHLVELSVWPLLVAFAAMVTVIGGVLTFHDHGNWVLYLGIVSLLLTTGKWFVDIVDESMTPGLHNEVVRLGFRWGMALFIFSEVCFFGAFFWAYFNASLFPTDAIGGMWPPKGIETFDPMGLPYINTLLLLLSGTTVTWAHHAIEEGDIKDTITKLGYTVLLGLTFTGVQVLEYMHAPFAFTDGIYASAFYLTTGFHGAHVIIGTIFLLVCWMRARAGHYTKSDHFSFEAAAWYWHFVDVVWIFLFISVYWFGA